MSGKTDNFRYHFEFLSGSLNFNPVSLRDLGVAQIVVIQFKPIGLNQRRKAL
ncbi:MAG: hypothetical protein IJV35_10175 [Neisseriaceae bacterium]|nr:hypothetical protein [Neisseriaceae bacterium]